jgi:RNA polymerase sigma factor (sigma-70 family)
VGSFERFYSAERGGVVGLVYTLVGDWHVAEDLTQEVFTRAYSRWDELEPGRPEAWVRTVAVNLVRSRARRIRVALRRQPIVSVPHRVEDPDPMPHELGRFWEEVRLLPRQQALAVALYYVEGREPSEMVEIMGCSAATARVHLHRARSRLQRRLSVLESKDPA